MAYDRGLVTPQRRRHRPDHTRRAGRWPLAVLTTAVIKNDVAGNIVTDINTAVATPRAPAAGYVAPEVARYEDASVRGTGHRRSDHRGASGSPRRAAYELDFANPSVWDTDPRPT